MKSLFKGSRDKRRLCEACHAQGCTNQPLSASVTIHPIWESWHPVSDEPPTYCVWPQKCLHVSWTPLNQDILNQISTWRDLSIKTSALWQKKPHQLCSKNHRWITAILQLFIENLSTACWMVARWPKKPIHGFFEILFSIYQFPPSKVLSPVLSSTRQKSYCTLEHLRN